MVLGAVGRLPEAAGAEPIMLYLPYLLTLLTLLRDEISFAEIRRAELLETEPEAFAQSE